MAFESNALSKLQQAFSIQGFTAPNMYWEHGTLWVDTDCESDMDTVVDVLENDVLAPGYKTSINCLKATSTEPWDQWAVDIVEDK